MFGREKEEWKRRFWLSRKYRTSQPCLVPERNSKEKQRKMPRNGIKCHVVGRWKEERFASNMHTWIQLACNMTFFWVVVSVSLEKYEQLLPFYYLCVCKSDSFIRLHFSNFCSLNAQIQTQIEIKNRNAFRILFLMHPLAL